MSGEQTSTTPSSTPAPAPTGPSAADVQVAHAQHALAAMTNGRYVPSMPAPSAPAAPTTYEGTREAMKAIASDLTLPKAVRETRIAELRKSLANFNKPPAAGTPATSVPELTPPAATPAETLEAKRRALNDPANQEGIWSNDPTKRDAARAELRKLLAQQSDAERPRAELTIEDKRAEFGLAAPKFLTPESAELWNADGEAQALDYAHTQGIEPAIVRDAMADYMKLGQMRDGALDDTTLDALEKKYQARGVPKEVTAAYRRWLRENDFI